ncbi:MAG: SusC/RagA family TonB-linked outer membrane protein [Tannerella sp.]|jgi:TonB-linked SusC/RagA family outer membrane protein|nr:SusC/RagA family TonB-linked outer membrane protein [Tannerella sp.]
MRKIIHLTVCLFIGMGFSFAQTLKVTGVVISADDSEPVMGATVVVKERTSIGTVTDIDGNFTLDVPGDGVTLKVSYVGMAPKEVRADTQKRMTILLSSNLQLDEIVVTAMGIKRSEKALGYAASQVSGEELLEARSSDIMTGLAGKMAGVSISSSSSDPGASNSVIIRGFSSLSGSNQPLFVIDGVPLNNTSTKSTDNLNSAYDFGNGANAVNPEDVASMTILKGAAATALYGSRAANGVILITTKSGNKQDGGFGIEYSGGLQFANILRLPEFQNEFGMGWSGDHTMIENGSWGARLDGSMQLWGSVYDNSQKLKPYAPLKNNVKDFFDTGFRYTNSVSFSGANDSGDYYVSLGHTGDDGLIPTAADTYSRYTFSTRGSYTVRNLKVSSSLNYANSQNRFMPTGQGLTMVNSLYQMPRDLSIIGLRDLSDPFNTLDYYYTPYGVTNPYILIRDMKNLFSNERFYGKLELSYDFLKYFNATYRLGYDSTSEETKVGVPEMKAAEGTANYDQIKNEGQIYRNMLRRHELNHDFLLSFDMPLNDFHVNAMAGWNANERKMSIISAQVTGLDIPTWLHLSNSPSTPDVTESMSMRRLAGVLGQAELGYKSLAYLTLTARNDWSSTLPKENRSFFYSGVTGSFVFSELLSDNLKKVISFGKFRAAWGQTGNDADPYMIDPFYAKTSVGLGFGSIDFPLGGINAFTKGNTLGSNTLQPEITTEWELGANISLFNRRISIDGAYYNKESDKQIFDLNMDPASGYSLKTVNLGKIANRGVELLVEVRPVEMKDFSWDVSWNYTKNESEVISLPEELGGQANIYSFVGGTGLYAIVGQPLGSFMASVPERDPNGNIVVGNSGQPVEAEKQEIIGNAQYDYMMGFSTTLKYKNVSLRADLDVRQGGLMYSRSKDILYFTGNAVQTLYNDRNTFIVPGSVQKLADGSYVENTTPIISGAVWEYYQNGADRLDETFLIDKSYVKLRSVVLSWDLPRKWFAGSRLLQSARLSAFGNNLLIWTAKENTFIDPEVTTFGNDLEGLFGEYSANPTTRKYGFNVTVKF